MIVPSRGAVSLPTKDFTHDSILSGSETIRGHVFWHVLQHVKNEGKGLSRSVFYKDYTTDSSTVTISSRVNPYSSYTTASIFTSIASISCRMSRRS